MQKRDANINTVKQPWRKTSADLLSLVSLNYLSQPILHDTPARLTQWACMSLQIVNVFVRAKLSRKFDLNDKKALACHVWNAEFNPRVSL